MDSQRLDSVWNAFSKLLLSDLQAIPKSDLSTYVLCFMIYLMSYDLYLMSYLMSYVIWSHGFGSCLVFRTSTYDLVTRVDALCLLSTGHLLRILIPLEEPPPSLLNTAKYCQYFTEYCGSPAKFSNYCKNTAPYRMPGVG